MEVFHKLELLTFAVAVERMKRTHENGVYHWDFGQDDKGNTWAIVLGWRDGFDEDPDDACSDGAWRLCVKLAYQPSNSMLQCDYDFDWLMPYDEATGEVDDTEFALYEGVDLNEVFEWLIGHFKEMEVL